MKIQLNSMQNDEPHSLAPHALRQDKSGPKSKNGWEPLFYMLLSRGRAMSTSEYCRSLEWVLYKFLE